MAYKPINKKCGQCGQIYTGQPKSKFCSTGCSSRGANLVRLWRKWVDEDSFKQAKKHLDASIRHDMGDAAKPLMLNADFTCVVSDVHVPFHNKDLTQQQLKVGYDFKKANPKKFALLVLGGDVIDFSSHYKHGFNESDPSWRRSIQDTGKYLDAFASIYDAIAWVPGNHDIRFGKRLEKLLGHRELVFLTQRHMTEGIIPLDYFHYTEYNYCVVNDEWLIIHPFNYSKKPCKVACDLAEVHKKNVIIGHTHHPPEAQTTKSGLYVGIENGCSLDENKVEYVKNATTFPGWGNGFTTLTLCDDGKTRYQLHGDLIQELHEELKHEK